MSTTTMSTTTEERDRARDRELERLRKENRALRVQLEELRKRQRHEVLDALGVLATKPETAYHVEQIPTGALSRRHR